jgi:recombination protein RecA
MKLGVMFGNPETTTGGNALKFYASVRMDIRNIGKIEEGTGDVKEIKGSRVRVKIVKNKIAPPFRTAEFDIMYNKGISYVGDLIDLSSKYEITRKSGAFYTYKDLKLGQGRENAKSFINSNEKVMKAIEKDILDHVGRLKKEEEEASQAVVKSSMPKATAKTAAKEETKIA